MKLIIDISEEDYTFFKENYSHLKIKEHLIDTRDNRCYITIANGTPFEFGNISVEAIEESSHCPACVHWVQGDVPNPFCEKCKNRDELYGRIEKGVLEQIAEEQKTLLDTTKAWSKALEHGDIY